MLLPHDKILYYIYSTVITLKVSVEYAANAEIARFNEESFCSRVNILFKIINLIVIN